MFPPFQRSGFAVIVRLLWKYIFCPQDASRVRRFPPTLTGLQQQKQHPGEISESAQDYFHVFLGEMMSVPSAVRCQSNACVEEQRCCLIGRCREAFFIKLVLLSSSGTVCT